MFRTMYLGRLGVRQNNIGKDRNPYKTIKQTMLWLRIPAQTNSSYVALSENLTCGPARCR